MRCLWVKGQVQLWPPRSGFHVLRFLFLVGMDKENLSRVHGEDRES